LTRPLPNIRRDREGSVVIEFALIGPVLLAMLMGVLQIGLGMQNYNALRGISAETARFAVVTRQADGTVSTTSLENHADSLAVAPPYGLAAARFQSNVSLAGTQRVPGATEYTLQLQYNVPTFLGFIGVGEIPLTFTRPIFVVT
jgi:Flp pilus assembly protein TadG